MSSAGSTGFEATICVALREARTLSLLRGPVICAFRKLARFLAAWGVDGRPPGPVALDGLDMVDWSCHRRSHVLSCPNGGEGEVQSVTMQAPVSRSIMDRPLGPHSVDLQSRQLVRYGQRRADVTSTWLGQPSRA